MEGMSSGVRFSDWYRVIETLLPETGEQVHTHTPSLVPLVRLVVALGLITNLVTGNVAGVDRPGKASV